MTTHGYKRTLRPCRQYVCSTPRSGHSSFDVRFSPDYVCLALNSGRSGGIAEGPFLTQTGSLGFPPYRLREW